MRWASRRIRRRWLSIALTAASGSGQSAPLCRQSTGPYTQVAPRATEITSDALRPILRLRDCYTTPEVAHDLPRTHRHNSRGRCSRLHRGCNRACAGEGMGVVAVMEPIALTREQAAELCGLTPTGFDSWVKRGIVPSPIRGTRRWSRSALERALAGVTAAGAEDDPDAIFNRWKAANAG